MKNASSFYTPGTRNGLLIACLMVLGFAVGCGSDEDGEVLLSTALVGTVNGSAFDPGFGAAVVDGTSGALSVILGTSPISCTRYADPASFFPSNGTYVELEVPSPSVGVASSQSFNFLVVDDSNISAAGSGSGSIEITEAGDASITMDVSFMEELGSGSYALNGTFTVVRCP